MKWGIRKQRSDGSFTNRGRQKLKTNTKYQNKIVKKINKYNLRLKSMEYQDEVSPMFSNKKEYNKIKTRRDTMLKELHAQRVAIGKKEVDKILTASSGLSLGIANSYASSTNGNQAYGSGAGLGVNFTSKRSKVTNYYLKNSKKGR